jgi:hypothetical protein
MHVVYLFRKKPFRCLMGAAAVFCCVPSGMAWQVSTDKDVKDDFARDGQRIEVINSGMNASNSVTLLNAPAKPVVPPLMSSESIPEGMAVEINEGEYLTSKGLYKKLDNGAYLTPEGLVIQTESGALIHLQSDAQIVPAD